jgi:hypothetical protein
VVVPEPGKDYTVYCDAYKHGLGCVLMQERKVIAYVTWICPLGTHRLVYRVWPIKKVDKYKDSKIDLETKKEGSNPYSTRKLVNSCPVAYIKPGRGAPRETTYNLDNRDQES